MKELRRNIRTLGAVLLCAFVFLLGYLVYTVQTQGSRWLVNQYNPRLVSAKNRVTAGDISDRNGVVLATTDREGKRQYIKDSQARRALSQTVGDTMGMSGTGVETFQAGYLYGMNGSIIDRTWQYVSGAQTRGDNLQLTIDAELTRYVSEQFPSGYDGAVVVLNYKTGEVLCMVSKPDYDPAKVSNRSSAPRNTDGTAYLNRVLQGQYAPGSVFKIVTAAAALDALPDAETRTFHCEGTRAYGEGTVVDYGGGKPHGELSLKQAFSSSCNLTFAGLGYELGGELLRRKAEAMGINDNFRFRDLVVYRSSYPAPESEFELAWSAVGQGRVVVTPLNMAMIAGAVANGGQMMEPNLIMGVSGVGGIPRARAPVGTYRRAMEEGTARTLKEYMIEVVKNGTGTRAKVKNHTIGGKTGTAQVSSSGNVRDTAWFVGFVAEEETPLAIAVVVEKGGTGGERAAPLAAKVLKKAISRFAGS